MKEIDFSTGVIIHSDDGRFLMNSYDETYPRAYYRRALNTFGGGYESGDVNLEETVRREIREELTPVVADAVLKNLTHISDYLSVIQVPSDPRTQRIVLESSYHSKIPVEVMDYAQRTLVNGGNVALEGHAEVLTLDEMFSGKRVWSWNTEGIFRQFMGGEPRHSDPNILLRLGHRLLKIGEYAERYNVLPKQ